MVDPHSVFSRRQLLASCTFSAGALNALAWPSNRPLQPDFRIPVGSPERSARDEDFWSAVRAEFELDSNRARINLGAGAYNAPPRSVHAALLRAIHFIHGMPNVNRSLAFGQAAREKLRARLAGAYGALPSEIAFTRGTTESLNILTAGMRLAEGDEILTTEHDYDSIKAAWKLRGLRDGVRLKEVALPHPPRSPGELVRILEEAWTPRTKVVLICHVTGTTGQIFPIREICDMAHSRGARVMVDGALALGVMPVDLHETNCDYYGASLHKGIYAPTGTGFLYVREELVEELLPLFGASEPHSPDVRKFEEIGTTPLAPLASVNAALDFHERIGIERIRARLHYLKKTWMNLLAESPGVVFHTSPDPEQSCAIAHVQIGKEDPYAVWRHIYNEHGISCGYSKGLVPGIVVRFHIHTMRSEAELCARALGEIAKDGIPDG